MSLLPDDTTPLDPQELAGLKLAFISTRAELNVAEALNVEAGLRWVGTRRPVQQILRVDFLRELRERMFGDVRKSAGHYRRSDKNVGVPWWQVSSQMVERCVT